MSELPNREAFEEKFARKFGKLSRQHRRELKRYLGNPPSLDNVPEEFWDKLRHDVESAVYDDLYSTFIASAEFHGWSDPHKSETKALGDMFRKVSESLSDAALAAYGWAKQRAESFARYWTDSTRERIRKGIEQPDAILSPETTIEEHRAANQTTEQEQPTITPEQLDELLDNTFGASRIEVNVVDEITRARHAGSESAIEATVGLSDDDIWEIDPKSNVCKICHDLDGTPRSSWPWRYADGPPAHPRCACNTRYQNFSGPTESPELPMPIEPEPKPNPLDKLTEAERIELWFEKIRGQKSLRLT